MILSWVTAYHSFSGEVEASNTPTIRRLTPSRRHQLPRITRYASAIAWGKRTDPKATNFPFADDLPGLDNNIERRGVCKHLPPKIIALFRSFQPYKGGNPTLWALNKLCNTKKHCALMPLQITNARANFNARLPPDATVGLGFSPEDVGTFTGWDSAKQEVTLATVPTEVKPHIRGNFTFSVAIDGVDVLRAQLAITALGAMRDIVAAILWRTEAECIRLGFDIS